MEENESASLIRMLKDRVNSLKGKNLKQSQRDLIYEFINRLESNNSLEDKEILEFLRGLFKEDNESFIKKNIMPIISLTVISTLLVFIIILAITGSSLTGGIGAAFLVLSNTSATITGYYFGKENKKENELRNND